MVALQQTFTVVLPNEKTTSSSLLVTGSSRSNFGASRSPKSLSGFSRQRGAPLEVI